MLILAQLPMWAISILVVFYCLVCVIMILAVLIQRPQGGGLSTAFGAGAGSGQTAFGTKIGDALTIFTISVFVLFLGTSVALVFLLRPDDPREQPTITTPEGTIPPTTTGTTGGTPAGSTPASNDQPAPPADPVGAGSPPAPGTEPDQPAGQPQTPPGA